MMTRLALALGCLCFLSLVDASGEHATAISMALKLMEINSSTPPRFLVTYKNKDDVRQFGQDVAGAFQRYGAFGEVGKYKLNSFANLGIGVLEFEHGTTVKALANAASFVMMALGGTVSIEPDSITHQVSVVDPLPNPDPNWQRPERRLSTEGDGVVPNDERWSDMWYLRDVGADLAWNTWTGAEVGADRPIICIIDWGTAITVPDIEPSLFTNEAELNGVEGVDDDDNLIADDIHSANTVAMAGLPISGLPISDHGTMVASVAGAKGNDTIGISSISWAPRLAPCKAVSEDGDAFQSNFLQCLDWAMSIGAKIAVHANTAACSSTNIAAYQRYIDWGGLHVAAAGNEGSYVGPETPDFGCPAAMKVEGVIGVAATVEWNNREIAKFSNWGKELIEIAAPGNAILAAKDGGGLYWAAGSSVAAPFVAGAAALLWSYEPSLTNFEVADLIRTTALKDFTGVDQVAWGYLDVDAAMTKLKSLKTTTTTTPATTAAPPATTTTTHQVGTAKAYIEMSLRTCEDACIAVGLECHEEETVAINSDMATCVQKLEATGLPNSQFTPMFSFSSWSWTPGCLVNAYNRGDYTEQIVYINTNFFNTGQMGCKAPATPELWIGRYNVCMCQ